MNADKIPQTDSIHELAHFWDTHDLTDFEEQLEEVAGPVFEREKVVQVFANQLNSQSDPLESVIAAELWRWAYSPSEARAEIASTGSKLATALEFYLCGVFHLIEFTRSRGIWCDGLIELSIERTTRCSFRIVGAAYCPHTLAPIEIEFHFVERRGHKPTRTIIRLGDPNASCSNKNTAARIVAGRPTSDHDWAVAVELTPGA